MSVDPSQLDPSKFRKGYGVQQDEEELSQDELRVAQIREQGGADPDPRYMASEEVVRTPVTQPQGGALPTTEGGGSKEPVVEGAGFQVPTDESLDQAVEGTGFQVPTDESLDAALDAAFDKNRPYLEDDPILGMLEWEDPSYDGATYPSASASASPISQLDPAGFRSHKGKPYEGPVEDDYGWGIKHAFMRGLIRAGSLIDIAQGDVKEYAEGMKAMEKWEVSKEDGVRLAELQESEGFWKAMGYYVQNPALAMQVVVESLPMSTAPLVGGAVGMAAAGPVGAVVGVGLGSFGTDYLASIGQSLTEHEVDVKDPTALMAAFADEKFMATARAHAAKHGIGVAAFDALSMGIAGRIYKPIKALTGTATKTGGTIGGLSELLAQGSAGALGELSGQGLAGDELNMVEAASEFIGELVPGVGEIAINKARGKDAGGKDPNAPDVPPDLDATPEGDVVEDTEQTISDTDVDEEGKAYIVPEAIEKEAIEETETPSAPELETATTTEEIIPEAPVVPEAEVSEPTQAKEVVEDKTTPETVGTIESVLINAKELKPKIDKQLKGTAEEQRPIRQAWRKLTNALQERYPDVELPTMSGRTNGTGFGKFFQKLQEEVDITQDLPDLKTYLETVTEGKPAEIIKSLERLTYTVTAGIPSTSIGEGGPILTQLRAVVNIFNETVKARAKKKDGGKARNVITWANAIGEMAAGVKAAVDDAALAGALEGLPADFNDTIASALKFADRAQSPRETRTPSGNKTKNLDGIGRKGLKAISDKLLIIADQVAEAIASKEVEISFNSLERSLIELDALIEGKSPFNKTKKGGTKGRVEPTLSSTAPVTSSKKDKQGRIEPTISMERPEVHQRNPLKVEELSEPEVVPTPNERKQQVAEKAAKRIAKNEETLKESRKVAKEGKGAGAKAAKASKARKNDANRARVPKKYHGKKFFFHAVANEDDVQSIVDNGLNIGTNVSRIDGQALEGEGDTILIFEGTASTESKGYQNDEVVTEMGLRPVAILKDTSLETRKEASEDTSGQEYAALNERIAEVAELYGLKVGDFGRAVDTADLKKNKELREEDWTEEQIKSIRELNKEQQRIFKNMERYEATVEGASVVTSQDVMEKYRSTGLPVFDETGKKLKKAVPGAKPDEVFDPEGRGYSGKKAGGSQTSGSLLEETGVEGTTLGAALSELGVSKAAADKLAVIYRSVTAKQKKAIVKAANSFIEHKEALRLAAEIAEAVGKSPSAEVLSSIMEFAAAIDEQASTNVSSVREEMVAAYAEDNNMSLEDAESILEDMGEIENQDPNRNWIRGDDSDAGKFTNLSRPDRRVLSRAMDKVRGFFDNLQRPEFLGHVDAMRQIFAGKLKIIPDVTMQEVLEQLSKALPKNHRYKILVDRLMELGLTVPVKFYAEKTDVNPEGGAHGQYNDGITFDWRGPQANRELVGISLYYNPDHLSDSRFIHNVLHEMVHAASIHAYLTDPTFRAHINELWRQVLVGLEKNTDITFPTKVREAINSGNMATEEILRFMDQYEDGIMGYYGLGNPVEMIAETFTNPRFQAALSEIEVENTPALQALGVTSIAHTEGRFTSAFVQLYRAITKFLGYSVRNNILKEIIFISNENFNNQQQSEEIFAGINSGKYAVDKATPLSRHFVESDSKADKPETDDDVTPMSTRTNDIVDKSLRESGSIGGIYKGIKEALKTKSRALNLGFMNRDVIERNYRDLFGKAAKKVFNTLSNPLTEYVQAKLQSSVLARKYEMKAYVVLMKAQKLSNTARAKMFGLMRDVTLSQVWPDKPLNHPDNAHLWSKPNKKTGHTYLKPKTAEMATQARKKFKALLKSDPQAAKIMMEMAALTKEIQKAKQEAAIEAVGASFELTGKQVKELQAAKTNEEIEALFPTIDEEAMEALKPVKEDSDATKAKKKEALNKAKENKYVQSSAKEILKGTSIRGPYFPLRRYGDYVVTTTSEDDHADGPLVVFVNSRWKAQKLSDDLNKAGRKTYVSTKIKSQAVSTDLENAVSEISKRLKGDDTSVMRARLETALVETLAENAAYASQLRRANVDGVAADDMGRAFEEYVHVSKYTIGDMTTAHAIQNALKDLKTMQSAEELTADELDTIGAVVNEISNQNKEDANDRDLSTVQKVVGAVGFFNFLGAPSYWALNATQTYTVTLPYLTAKWGIKGPAALTKAQATVLNAVAKALASNDKSYEGFVKQLPPAAQRIVKQLEDENVIQSTIAHEFGDILSPGAMTRLIESTGAIGRPATIGLKMMEKVPEAVEHFNRISTALAAYNLSGDIVATVDAVQATQFNYDSANRARLLKALPLQAGGGARAVVTPIMMFKTYGIGVSRLLYGSMFDAVMKKEGRGEAIKLAGGLIVTHTMFGGVAGGLMLAPLSMLLGIFNQAFREAGDEFDPEEAVEEFLRDVGFDAVAVMARRGIPAGAGVDMSKSINLGNLLWMGNDRYDLAESGGVEQALAGILGPVAQYGITTTREGYRLVSGDNRGNWADFLAAITPLKVARGIIKGNVYGSEGLHTDSDLQFLNADEISGWARLAMGLGFRSTTVGSSMDAYYGELARQRKRDKRKSQLIEQLLRAESAAEYNKIWREVVSFNRSLERRKDWVNRGDVVRLKSQRRSRQRTYDRQHRR